MSVEWWLMSMAVCSSSQPLYMREALSCSSFSLRLLLMSDKRTRSSCTQIKTSTRFIYFSFLSRLWHNWLWHNFKNQFKNTGLIIFKNILHRVSGVALLSFPHLLSYHQISCWSPSATETLTPASCLDASDNAWTALCRQRDLGHTSVSPNVMLNDFIVFFYSYLCFKGLAEYLMLNRW